MKPSIFTKKKAFRVVALLAVVLFGIVSLVSASEGDAEYVSNFYGTFWALVPPIIAIALALITKEVYTSLFVGILVGGLLYANFNPFNATVAITEMFMSRVGDAWNAGILVFLVVLGIFVALMNKTGGSRAYGDWAAKHIKSRRGAMLASAVLSVFFFIDDYFNCLTVGSVMHPVTDKFKVSRAKLSYMVDSMAAPVVILAPISSWAAAVTSSVDPAYGVDGFQVFLQAIPYNYYAWMTILFLILLIVLRVDYGPMYKAEKMAVEDGDLFMGAGDEYGANAPAAEVNEKGKVIDLVLPVIVLILTCLICMLYTGGLFSGAPFLEAFANCDASLGLSLGSIISLLFAFVYYMLRRVITFKQFAESLPEGFRQMVPAIMVLTFAWTLSGFCRESLGASEFVGSVVAGNAAISGVLPAIMFVIACGVAFATGTSWGTFGILIPIAQAAFGGEMGTPLVMTMAACMAGAVFGDHCSPISDTTIMSSAGSRVNHIVHVSTQVPYALTVGAITLICYLLGGFVQNAVIMLIIAIALTVGTVLVIRFLGAKKYPPLKDTID